jgi:hypothetical protein
MPSMFILIEFHPFLLMQFLCRCWQKAFAATADFMQILSHILHEHLSPKKAQNEHARQCPPYSFELFFLSIETISWRLSTIFFDPIMDDRIYLSRDFVVGTVPCIEVMFLQLWIVLFEFIASIAGIYPRISFTP